MVWPVLNLATCAVWFAKCLQRLIFWSSGECVITSIRPHLPVGHEAVNDILWRLIFLAATRFRECIIHLTCGLPTLAGVGLIDNYGEAAPAMRVPNLFIDEREFLHGRYDNL